MGEAHCVCGRLQPRNFEVVLKKSCHTSEGDGTAHVAEGAGAIVQITETGACCEVGKWSARKLHSGRLAG